MGRHKGSGEGTIYKQGTRWRGQISLGGERRSVSGRTKKEVADKLAELRVKFNKGEYTKRNDITVGEWCTYWLEKKVKNNISEQSFIRLSAMFQNHIYPELGDELIQNLDRETLEETYAKVFRHKKEDKKYAVKDYSHSTVNALSVQFKKCLQYAVDSNIISKNPHNGVELHKLREPKKIDSYTCTDQDKIVRYCKCCELPGRVFYFLVSTGIRFGEAVALTWNDINFETGEICINKTAVSIHGSMIIQNRPKTAAGNRTIFIGKNIIEWLSWHRSTLDEDANYRNLVFPNTRYNIINQQNAILKWQKICDQIGIRYQGMHSLRHTWATRALEAGIDVKVVSKILGHKNVITTMNIYQDVLDSEKIKAACTLDAQF